MIGKSGYSRTAFYRRFSEAMRCSPAQYIHQRKLQTACALLLQGFSVAQTAERTGFYDVAYFGKQFRRRTGVAPSAYRRYIQDQI